MAVDTVKLRVGGQLFETTVATLRSVPGTFFDSLVAERWRDENCNTIEMFIDRSPRHFDRVLNYLRDGRAVLPGGREEREEMLAEAGFYGLDLLQKQLQESLHGNEMFFKGDIVEWRARDLPALLSSLGWHSCLDRTQLPYLLQTDKHAPCSECGFSSASARRLPHASRDEVQRLIIGKCVVLEMHPLSCVSLLLASCGRECRVYHVPSALLTRSEKKYLNETSIHAMQMIMREEIDEKSK